MKRKTKGLVFIALLVFGIAGLGRVAQGGPVVASKTQATTGTDNPGTALELIALGGACAIGISDCIRQVRDELEDCRRDAMSQTDHCVLSVVAADSFSYSDCMERYGEMSDFNDWFKEETGIDLGWSVDCSRFDDTPSLAGVTTTHGNGDCGSGGCGEEECTYDSFECLADCEYRARWDIGYCISTCGIYMGAMDPSCYDCKLGAASRVSCK